MTVYNPEQKRAIWCENVFKEAKTSRKAYLKWNMPFGSWLTPKQQEKEATYYNNNREHPEVPFYDRFFDCPEGYNQKLHRCDRATRIKLNVMKEETEKSVPLLSSSVYGFIKEPLETQDRKHVRVEAIKKQFYRKRGTNLPRRPDKEHVLPNSMNARLN